MNTIAIKHNRQIRHYRHISFVAGLAHFGKNVYMSPRAYTIGHKNYTMNANNIYGLFMGRVTSISYLVR